VLPVLRVMLGRRVYLALWVPKVLRVLLVLLAPLVRPVLQALPVRLVLPVLQVLQALRDLLAPRDPLVLSVRRGPQVK
jgi:hypothetical protein